LAGRHNDGLSDRRWTAVLVLAVGLVATLVVSRAVGSHEQSELHWATKVVSQAIRADLVTDMEWQILGLDRLAMLWEAADPGQELWTRNAELYIQHRTGCVAVEWLSPSGERRVVVKAGGQTRRALAFDGTPKALIEAVTASKVPMISAPVAMSDGSRQWAGAYPVYVQGESRGFIVTFFDYEKSVDYILADVKDFGFSFAVLTPDQPEYIPSGTSRRHEQEWGQLVDVPLSGTTWQLRVWPTADVVNEITSRLPEVTLAVGSVLSLLLALTLYFGAGAALSSARMRQVNLALEREISAREGAQKELRRAHAELEVRIDQRTAELAGSNALLRKEVTAHQRAEASLTDLTSHLFQLQDEERRRLAREVHDGAVQNLVALAMDVGMIGDTVRTEDIGTKELVNECVRLIEESTNQLRTISYLLHPPYFDELGLTASLRDFVDGFATRSGIQITLDIDPRLGRLGHQVELAIYRVVQEALSNVHRHAHSRTATIALARHPDCVQLEIADAGRGIPPEILAPSSPLAGVGIAGMRERVKLLGGQLDIQSSGSGTRVHAVFPMMSETFGREALSSNASAIGSA
jgi:signal transduction histidine kinase